MKRYRVLIDRILVCIACLALWQIASWILGTYWVSTPWATISRFFVSLWDGELIRHAGYTVEEAALGGVIGAVPAIILPFALRRFPTIVQIIDPFMIGGYGLPKLALAPLFILWFGIGITTKVVFVASIVFFLMFYNGLAGILSIDPRLVAMLRVAGASQWAVTREIVWNTTKPFLFSGLKIALPRALSGAVVGEFIAADAGLGWYIQNARSLNDTTGVVAGAVVVTVLVIGVNAALKRVQARSLAWRPVSRDMTI